MTLIFSCFLGSLPWCERSWCPSGTLRKGYARLLASLANMKVLIRVTSAWKARAMRSSISRMCSRRSGGDAAGSRDARRRAGAGLEGPGLLDPPLDLADRVEVLVDLAPVARPELGVELPGVLEHEVEHAPLSTLPAGAIGRRGVARPRAEEAVEEQPGVDLLGHRHVLRLPGDVRRVGAAIARVAATGLGRGVDPQLERRQARAMADLHGRDLVDRDARPDIGPVGLERVRAGQEAGQRARVVAPFVAHRRRILLGQAAEDEQVLAEGLERPERRGQAETRTGLARASSRPCGRRWARRGTRSAWGSPRRLRRPWPAQRRAPSPRARAAPRPRPCRARRPAATAQPTASSRRLLLSPPAGQYRRLRNGSLDTIP